MKKDKDFLSQIPEWEKEYKNSEDNVIDFEKNDWKTAKASFSDHDLFIFGCAVMEDWETPYMKDLAEIVASRGGTVLELGFGMGISAKFIQNYDIKKHIIIEANSDVAKKAREFAKMAKHETVVLEGFWEDMIKDVHNNSIDGILFDTYPLAEKELYQNHFNFFPFAFKKLKPGGIFTYYSDEVIKFSDLHLKKLQEAGFNIKNIDSKLTKVNPPLDCEYWKASTILSPIIRK